MGMGIGQARFVVIGVILVLFVCEKSAIRFTNVGSLGNKGNVTSLMVNVSFLNLNFQATAEVNPYVANACDKVVVFKTRLFGLKVRTIAKGSCSGCCRIEPTDIKIQLYTKDNPNKPITLPQRKRPNQKYPNLSKNNKVVMFIHGFVEITEIGNANDIKNAYLSKDEDYAVLIIDWSELVSFPWYFDAIVNVRKVAAVVAKFLESYIDSGDISLKNLHIVGFSLGAHVAGFIGKYLRPDLRLPRITGLDPAYPGFQRVSDKYRLSKSDADFVDVIHTDGGNFGFMIPSGHVDFFPNGGTYYQPGCNFRELEKINQIYYVFSCSHNRAQHFYVESVQSPYNFPATKCYMPTGRNRQNCNNSDVAYMGFIANKKYRGTYYLKTNKVSPFGRSAFDIRSGDR